MKAVGIVMRYFSGIPGNSEERITQKRNKTKVNKKDIVEAEFEDITDEK